MPATTPLRHPKECRRRKCNNGEIPHATLRKSICIFEEKVLAKNTITSDTTDEYKYEVNLSGIRDLIIRYNCHAVDSGFCGGMIVNEL